MSFSYTQLDPGNAEIRLVKLPDSFDASAPDIDPILHCSLVNVSLNSDPAPVYETISYCWGDPAPSSEVWINDLPLKVPASSANVLQQVAARLGQRYVWIDAVCIDQANIEERACQVQLMRRIYSDATRNIVCLGNDATTHEGVDAIHAIVKEVQQHTHDAGFDDFQDYLGAIWRGDVELTDLIMRTVIDEDALLAIYSHPWFSRTWIVQEAVLAPQAICICGPHTIDLMDFLQVAVWLSKYPAYNISERFQTHMGLMNAGLIHEARSQLAIKGALRFSDALTISSPLQTTDLRDKVYAILGLCFQDEVPALLSVDYSRPWQHVLRDATKYVILNTNYTAVASSGLPFILRWISHREQSDLHSNEFSSWMPRVDREGDPAFDDMTLFVHGARELPGNEEIIAKESDDPRSILLHGTRLGIVQLTTPTLEPATLQDKNSLSQYFDNLLRITQTYSIDSDCLSRTLIADTNFRSDRSTPDDRAGFTTMLDHIQRKATVPSLSDLSTNLEQQISAPATFYHEAFLQASRNRRFAITDQGDVALVPRACQNQDIVVAVYGDAGGTPYVLRPDADGFRLVGACYLDGRMPWQEAEETPVKKRVNEWFQVY